MVLATKFFLNYTTESTRYQVCQNDGEMILCILCCIAPYIHASICINFIFPLVISSPCLLLPMEIVQNKFIKDAYINIDKHIQQIHTYIHKWILSVFRLVKLESMLLAERRKHSKVDMKTDIIHTLAARAASLSMRALNASSALEAVCTKPMTPRPLLTTPSMNEAGLKN